MQFGWVGSAEPVGGKFGSVRPWVRSSRWCWSGAGGYHLGDEDEVGGVGVG